MIRALRPAGEAALIVYLGDTICEAVVEDVRVLSSALEHAAPAWLREIIPSYTSVLVTFDPLAIEHRAVAAFLRGLVDRRAPAPSDSRTVTLPVYYSAEVGADLETVAAAAGITGAEVAARHSAILYRVYAIGFAPGFAYLGSVDESLAISRHATPRRAVPRGSVAIADRQTAVYPLVSPGGWHLIGCCPTRLFDPTAERLPFFRIGDRVRFEAIDRYEYLRLGGQVP